MQISELKLFVRPGCRQGLRRHRRCDPFFLLIEVAVVHRNRMDAISFSGAIDRQTVLHGRETL